MLTQVTGCKDCPFFDKGTYETSWDYSTCKKQPFLGIQDGSAAHISDNLGKDEPITPNWCPLKKEPITIFYKPEGKMPSGGFDWLDKASGEIVSTAGTETVTIQITKDNFFNY